MKRIVNRYGKITLASLGGCLMTIGTFLIVLSAATVTNVANADTWTLGDCSTGGSPTYPIAGMHCTGYDLLDAEGQPGTDGVDDYWECCKYCAEAVAGTPADFPGCDIKAEYDWDYDQVTDHVDVCCNQPAAAPGCNHSTCTHDCPNGPWAPPKTSCGDYACNMFAVNTCDACAGCKNGGSPTSPLCQCLP